MGVGTVLDSSDNVDVLTTVLTLNDSSDIKVSLGAREALCATFSFLSWEPSGCPGSSLCHILSFLAPRGAVFKTLSSLKLTIIIQRQTHGVYYTSDTGTTRCYTRDGYMLGTYQQCPTGVNNVAHIASLAPKVMRMWHILPPWLLRLKVKNVAHTASQAPMCKVKKVAHTASQAP